MSELLKNIEDYYARKLREFGPTAKGVDWNSDESQQLRFEKLLSVVEPAETSFSLLDYGCGFGSMYSFMKRKFDSFSYTGFDISSEMIGEAKKLFGSADSFWINVLPEGKKFDYAVASGLFNVRLKSTEDVWIEYMHSIVNEMNAVSEKGFSFNVLSKYSDPEKRKDYLYYADPAYWFDHCKKKFSYKVALLHDYPLYEFTIQVKK